MEYGRKVSLTIKCAKYMNIKVSLVMSMGYAVAQLVEALRYKPEGRGFDCRCHWNFSLTYYFRSNRNKYQEYFLGVKAAVA